MSKPVTNVEIEDVLSSIRRLVSTSDRAERGEADTPDDVAEKLVLTPALRVDEVADGVNGASDESVENQDVTEVSEGAEASFEAVDDGAEDITTVDAEGAPGEAFFEKIAEAAAPEEAVATVEDIEGGEEDAAVATGAEDSLDALDEILSETTDNSNEIDDVVRDAQDMASDGENPPEFLVLEEHERTDGAGDAADDGTANNLQRRAAEFEAIIATTEDAWDPDGTTEDENAASPVGPLPWQEDADDADHVMASEDADGVVEFAESDFVAEETAPASETVEEPEDKVEDLADVDADAKVQDNAISADVSEESAEDVDLAQVMADLARAPASSDAEPVEADTEQSDDDDLQELMSDPEPAPFVFRSQSSARLSEKAPEDPGDTTAPLAIEEAMLDEDALRDMVSEIVRQELQGALGERITRNVRKLVRREIHRALASQELE